MSNKKSNSNSKSKSNSKVVNGIDTVGHIARNNLERFGSLLDGINAKSGKANHFKAVDLSNFETGTANNLLSQQTLKTSQQLMGGRFSTYGKFAKKVLPDSMVQKATDSVFSQVAKLAATWSQIDLPSEHRLEGIQELNDQQRNALARDIANQNRALATMGGVSGLAGLPGMLADTFWLLLVSLRSVYQLASVYDKPLTGKQGVKMAYAVLSHADLSKMQEKQTVLTALGLAKGLASNVDNATVRDEITKGLGNASTSVKFYAEQVDKLAEQFDLDINNINLGWLTKLLPIASVATTVHYNSHLIDQVIGVAQATFGPEPIPAKEALADKSDSDKTDSDQTDKSSSDESKDSSDAKQSVKDSAQDNSQDKTADDTKAEQSSNEHSKDNTAKDDKNSDNPSTDQNSQSESESESESKKDTKSDSTKDSSDNNK